MRARVGRGGPSPNQQRHDLGELELGDGAVAVLVPVPEEIDHAHRVLSEHAAQLLGHRGLAVRVNLDRGGQRGAFAPPRGAP